MESPAPVRGFSFGESSMANVWHYTTVEGLCAIIADG